MHNYIRLNMLLISGLSLASAVLLASAELARAEAAQQGSAPPDAVAAAQTQKQVQATRPE
jgi:hypothetical protein